MKKLIKILSFLMALLVFSTSVLAESPKETVKNMMDNDLDYFEDVYRFDLSIQKETQDDTKEKLTNPNAVFMVLTLGIMKNMPDGTFSENLIVTYPEFASMVYTLSAGTESGFVPDYSSFDNSNITVGEATYHVLNALGYTMGRAYGSFDEMALAQKIGLFKGGIVKKESLVTRGFAAQLFYNALEIDMMAQVSFGGSEKYSVQKGSTLLSDVFNVERIEGTVNATPGINIYSTVLPENDQIQIDRAVYMAGKLDFTDLLGMYVEGYVKIDAKNDYPIVLGLRKSDKGNSIKIKLTDIESVSSNEIKYYDGNKLKSINISDVKNVLYNADSKVNYKFTEALIDKEGEIVFTGGKYGKYTNAIIKDKSSYTVRHIAEKNKKIFLNNGLLFNGSDYIDVSNEDDDRFIRIVKDGAIISLADIKVNNAISVIQRADKRYTYIEVSDKTASGIVNARNDNMITVGNKDYYVTSLYEEASQLEDSTARNFVRGDSGVFYLTGDGFIAGYSGNDGIKYGIISLFGKTDGMDPELKVRIFTENSEWITAMAAKKIELDGKEMTKLEAADVLDAEKEAIAYNPVRFKLNSDGELVFLDTMSENEYSDSEKALSPKQKITWSGETNWTSPYVIYNGGESYSIFDAKMFIVPDETKRDNEDLYSVQKSTSISSGVHMSIDIYSRDELGHAALLVRTTSVGTDLYGSRIMVVEKVRHSTGDDGDRDVIIGYQHNGSSPGVGTWDSVTLSISDQLLKKEPTVNFKPGDVVLYAKDSSGKELIGYKILVRDGVMYNGQATTRFDANTNITYAYGIANAFNFDSSAKLMQVKADLGSGTFGTYTFVPRGVIEWKSSEKRFNSISLDEISPGEKVIVSGQGCHVCAIVLR